MKEELAKSTLPHECRVRVIHALEDLHTFSGIINRTRRRDIGEFTVREPKTVPVEFTPEQRELHDSLLAVQARILSSMKLLSVSVLEAMPIQDEDFPPKSMFRGIYDAVAEALTDEDLAGQLGMKGSGELETLATLAKRSGLDIDDINLMKKFKDNSPEQFEKIKKIMRGKSSFPERSSANVERRTERAKRDAKGALGKEYEKRWRSVRITCPVGGRPRHVSQGELHERRRATRLPDV